MTDNLPMTMQKTLSDVNVMKRIETRLGEKAGTFITSVLDLCGEDNKLVKCDHGLVIKEALKAAALDLPINKNLGFAYVIPYNESKKVGNKWVKTMTPHFQMGWKGHVQLAIRTGQYKHINPGVIYEGEQIIEDRIKGTLAIGGEKKSDTAIGYFCYMELLNGFQKAVVWTKERVEAHAKRFSKSYAYYLEKKSGSKPVWVTDFDSMALKTMFLQAVPKYGPVSIEMSSALSQDRADFAGFDNQVENEINQNANEEVIDIPTDSKEPTEDSPIGDEEKAEIIAQEKAAAEAEQKNEPGF